ncbi:Bifunctional folate synthesis protein [Phycisphaerae bacterium RAS2]|nr:Bifunctional folate synthesis protein [Phycisphaerae bacterium RAS2]
MVSGPARHIAFIGLGSNLGNREKNISAALNALEATREIDVLKTSALYETDPVGGPDGQGKYLNAVAQVRTTLTAPRLLHVCRRIEDSLQRQRAVHHGPRTMDLDILAFDDEIHSSPELMIPHPLMHERRFVMEPLAEIAPDWVHPALDQNATELLARIGSGESTGSDD